MSEQTRAYPAQDLLDLPQGSAQTLRYVADALREKGYAPVTQIVGYLVSGDPAYITNHRNARLLIKRLDRDDLLEEIVRHYLETRLGKDGRGA